MDVGGFRNYDKIYWKLTCICNGIYVDFYNLHADAYGGEGSIAARTSQFKQLAEFIQARSAENDRPVIVTGDFNNYMHVHENDGALYKMIYLQCGLKDAWIEHHNNYCFIGGYDLSLYCSCV